MLNVEEIMTATLFQSNLKATNKVVQDSVPFFLLRPLREPSAVLLAGRGT